LKSLEDILESVVVKNKIDTTDDVVNGIALDSRKVDKGFLFMAYKGVALDGHDFIKQAIEKGAEYILIDNESYLNVYDAKYILVDDAKKVSSKIAAGFFDYPTEKLVVTGVTGTNGKTSVASLLYGLFGAAGIKSGLVSTIENRYLDVRVDSKLTTPDTISLQALFRKMLDAGVTHVFMEVSSHALDQGRVDNIDFDLAVFTNITHDHLDYHGTFSEYIKAKKLLFDNLDSSAKALVNLDDRNGEVMVQNSKAEIFNYALKRPSDFKGKVIANEISGLHLSINGQEVYLRLIGHFNAYNGLAIYGTAVTLGLEEHDVLRLMSQLRTAEGRMDFVQSEDVGYTGIVDYAHTPDALEKVLSTLSDIKTNDSQLIAIVGAGGNRDKAKRPKMAKIGFKLSDVLIVTSDNPRDEEPDAIIKDMLDGLTQEEQKNVLQIQDRKEAIKMACMLAKDGDIILIAGKGHEKYQEIKGQRFPFDDKKIISAFMH